MEDVLGSDEGPGRLRVTMLLCDAAQVTGGKLFVLGGGVTLVGPQPQPLALALALEVPWSRANVRHQWTVDLVDEDGRPVRVNDAPLAIGGEFEAGRPAGLRPGTPLPVLLAIGIPPLPYPAGRRYAFRLLVDHATQPDWQVAFSTRPAAP